MYVWEVALVGVLEVVLEAEVLLVLGVVLELNVVLEVEELSVELLEVEDVDAIDVAED